VKISMMTYTMARGRKKDEKFDVKGLCEFTRELGLDAVDWVTTYEYDPREIRQVTDDYGLKNICHTFSCDLNFPSPHERAPGRDRFKRGIDAALVLGADMVMLPVKGREGLSREQSRSNVIAGLKEVVGFAEDAGVTVTVEHFSSPTAPFIVSADVNGAVAEVPQLRVTYDNGNLTTGGETAADGFFNSARYIVHAHFKDFARCSESDPGARRYLDGNWYRAVLVGDGDVDQAGSVRAMKKCGYQGYINFEYEGSDYSPREATIEGVRRIRELIRGDQC